MMIMDDNDPSNFCSYRFGDGGGGETWWGTLAKPRAEPRSEARIVIAYIMIVDVMSTCAAG